MRRLAVLNAKRRLAANDSVVVFVNLFDAGASDRDVLALADGIDGNSVMNRLDLRWNADVTDAAMSRLKEAVARSSVKQVQLAGTAVSDAEQASMKELCRENAKRLDAERGPDLGLNERQRLLGESRRRLNVCKVIVVGDGRAGKTSLVKSLRGEAFNPREESTEGLEGCTVVIKEERWDTVTDNLKSSGLSSFEEQMALALLKDGKTLHNARDSGSPRDSDEPVDPWTEGCEIDVSPHKQPRGHGDSLPRPKPRLPRSTSKPLVIKEPRHHLMTRDEGFEFSLTIEASGGLPGEVTQCQWLKDNVRLDGKTDFTVRLPAVTETDAGVYQAQVWCGSQPHRVTSRGTRLVVSGVGFASKIRQIIAEKGDTLTEDAPTVVVNDFAGQRMYYILHSLMMTEALTIYVVVVSLEHKLDEMLGTATDDELPYEMSRRDNLEFWMNQINAHAPTAKILLVCTKVDLVSDQERDQRLEEIDQVLAGKPYEDAVTGPYCVSNRTDEGVEEVRHVLRAEARPFNHSDGTGLVRYGDSVPLSWFKFHSITKALVASGERHMSLSQAMELGRECQVADGDLAAMLEHYNDIGFLLWSNKADASRDLVVLDPKWMIEQMTQLVCRRSIHRKRARSRGNRTHWTKLAQEGKLHPKLLAEMWPGNVTQSERKSLLAFATQFGLCCKLTRDEEDSIRIVPALLPSVVEPSAVRPYEMDRDKVLRVRMAPQDGEFCDDYSYCHDILFYRLMASLVGEATSDGERFKLFADRIVSVLDSHDRYMLHFRRDEQMLYLAIFDESSPVVVAQRLRHHLMLLQRACHVCWREEVNCVHRGVQLWHSLDDLAETTEAWLTWRRPETAEGETTKLRRTQSATRSRLNDDQRDRADAAMAISHLPPRAKKFDFFICHHQGSGGDQSNHLCILLEQKGFRVWCDNQRNADHRNLQGMRDGVRASECILIFLSGRKETNGQADINGKYEGPFTRWFCHEEMATAHQERLRCIGVKEEDPRHGAPDFAMERSRALTGGREGGAVNPNAEKNVRLLDEICFIPYRRQKHEIPGLLDEIARQSTCAARLPHYMPTMPTDQTDPPQLSSPRPPMELRVPERAEHSVLTGQCTGIAGAAVLIALAYAFRFK